MVSYSRKYSGTNESSQLKLFICLNSWANFGLEDSHMNESGNISDGNHIA